MQDNKNEKKDVKKLTLTVRNVETLEARSSPNTVCPEGPSNGSCCRNTNMRAAQLTAVAYF